MEHISDENELSEQLTMPSFDFSHSASSQQEALLAKHRTWINGIRKERPLPKCPYKVAVYIRYFNQTKYSDYLSVHKKQFLDTLALCPKWKFAGFYIDQGSNAPNMERSESWTRLLQDCFDGKADLILTQKISNISKNLSEISFCARLLAALEHPVGIYFISEDIFTLASYYQDDLRDSYFLPCPDWQSLSDQNGQRGTLHD